MSLPCAPRMVPLVCVVVLFWLGVFYVALAAQGISAADFLWGRRVPLPTHLGRWVDVGVGVDGRMRQERRLLPGGQGDPSCLILQVRFLDPKTGEIVAVLPEQREERRRSRSSR